MNKLINDLRNMVVSSRHTGEPIDTERVAAAIAYYTNTVDSVANNPLIAYAESYRMMSRIGDGKVACLSVAYDIERNMAKHVIHKESQHG